MVSQAVPAGRGWRWVTPWTSQWFIAEPPTVSHTHTHTYRQFSVANRPSVDVSGWWEEAWREASRNIRRTHRKPWDGLKATAFSLGDQPDHHCSTFFFFFLNTEHVKKKTLVIKASISNSSLIHNVFMKSIMNITLLLHISLFSTSWKWWPIIKPL